MRHHLGHVVVANHVEEIEITEGGRGRAGVGEDGKGNEE
jgi:hypothetical protein